MVSDHWYATVVLINYHVELSAMLNVLKLQEDICKRNM
jgi:hypothetical protein